MYVSFTFSTRVFSCTNAPSAIEVLLDSWALLIIVGTKLFAASSLTFSTVGKSRAIVLSAARSSNLGLAPPLVCTLITVSTWILSRRVSVKIFPSFSLVAASTSVKLISVPLYVSLETVNGLLRNK